MTFGKKTFEFVNSFNESAYDNWEQKFQDPEPIKQKRDEKRWKNGNNNSLQKLMKIAQKHKKNNSPKHVQFERESDITLDETMRESDLSTGESNKQLMAINTSSGVTRTVSF